MERKEVVLFDKRGGFIVGKKLRWIVEIVACFFVILTIIVTSSSAWSCDKPSSIGEQVSYYYSLKSLVPRAMILLIRRWQQKLGRIAKSIKHRCLFCDNSVL